MIETLAIAIAILILLIFKVWKDREDKPEEPVEDNSRPNPVTKITVEIKER